MKKKMILILATKCAECKFEAKNSDGLKAYINSDHKITCKQCDYKITTKMYMKQHKINQKTKQKINNYLNSATPTPVPHIVHMIML